VAAAVASMNAPASCAPLVRLLRCFALTAAIVHAATVAVRHASDALSAHRAAAVPHTLILGPDARPTQMVFVVTASLSPNNRNAHPLRDTNSGERNVAKRRRQYERGIGRLVSQTSRATLPLPHQIVVVENNGARKTFLEDLDGVDEVLYTDGNGVEQEKGLKELDDVMAVVEQLGMEEADMVVKMTGRYYLDDGDGDGDGDGEGVNDGDQGLAPFLAALRDLDVTATRAVVKFGTYARPVDHRVVDCVTGLIAVPVAVLRNIDRSVVPIAPAWARSVLSLPEDEVVAVQGKMGIHIAPAGKPYYVV